MDYKGIAREGFPGMVHGLPRSYTQISFQKMEYLEFLLWLSG